MLSNPQNSNRGVNGHINSYNLNNELIIGICDHLVTPLKIVRRYIPDKVGIRSSHCYHLLLLVCGYPRQAISYYTECLNTRTDIIDKNISYLLDLGYVKTIGRPRLIKPFQRFKVDTGYVITAKGKEVIYKIMSAVK